MVRDVASPRAASCQPSAPLRLASPVSLTTSVVVLSGNGVAWGWWLDMSSLLLLLGGKVVEPLLSE